MSTLLGYVAWVVLGVVVLGVAAYGWDRWTNRKGQR